ncbi:DegV family protein [Thermoanaerobacterium sp. DL9XJH110]|uniref:DegV family protein n=1 Tax=Thermoanaerobacterium sp. DL9XJH110 TaxID=3386643 RepID=UPI003BB60874
MKRAIIITDSSCDLPEEVINRYPIRVMPMAVSVKDNPGMDISNLTVKEFYDMMRQNKILPTTSQVTVPSFMKVYEECINQNLVPIVLGLSSRLTGSYQSALMAKENLKADEVIVIDSRCASLGLGLAVLKAAKMAEEGRSPEEIAGEAERYAHHMEHIFTVDSLDHLRRGGRISAAQAFVGGLLNIKPILHFVDGAIHPLEKVRGRKNVVRRMVEIMAERGKNLEDQLVGISHGDNEELAAELADAVKKEFGVREIMTSWIGPVIGAHSGPGTVALFFQNA